jgi:hypothetical protein
MAESTTPDIRDVSCAAGIDLVLAGFVVVIIHCHRIVCDASIFRFPRRFQSPNPGTIFCAMMRWFSLKSAAILPNVNQACRLAAGNGSYCPRIGKHL